MKLTQTVLAISAVWLCATGTGAAFLQSLVPTGPSNGGFGFECDTTGATMECECYGDRDCAALGATDICEQIVIVVDGEQRSVDALICETGPDGHPASPPDCHCSGPIVSDTSWLELYQLDAPSGNAPLYGTPGLPGDAPEMRRNEVVNARRGAEERQQNEAQGTPQARNRRDHRDDH